MNTASYERTVTVQTFAYTATIVATSGERTATLTARQDWENPHRREIQCPNCSRWYRLEREGTRLLPVHCSGCVIGLYDLVEQPVVVEAPESLQPAQEAATPAAKADLFERARERAAQLREEMSLPVDQKVELPEWAQAAYPGQCDDCPGRSHPLCCWSTEDKQPAADEQDALIAELALKEEPDRQRYFAARSGKYVLLHLRSNGLAVDCSCGDRFNRGRKAGRACKHMRAHNNMIKTSAA